MKTILLFITLVTTIFVVNILGGSTAQSLRVDAICSDVDIVFARGSGQSLNSDESARFITQINARVPDSTVTKNFYELGTESYGGQTYPAISIDEWWKNSHAVGAAISAGQGNEYGKSVTSGSKELHSYLTQRNARCPDAHIILGGYSQGAQVIGQTLPDLSPAVQAKVNFVTLLGDPKLYLPEGEGIEPAACRGVNLSEWRRTIGNCKADNGALGARKPFLPSSMTGKTGLWCNGNDFICGTSKKVWDNGGHAQYKDSGGAIDQAVVEIAQRLKLALPPAKAIAVDAGKHIAGMGTTGSDTVFLLTSSGWTPERFAQAKEFIRSTALKLQEQRGRVALVFYDGSVNGMGMFHSALSFNDQGDFHQYLNDAKAKESTTPIKPTLRALKFALDEFEWKQGASKSVVVLSESDFFNPDDYGLTTFGVIAKRALEIDPVNVFPVVPSSLQSSYQELAEVTSGQVIVSGSDPAATLAEGTKKIIQRPTALFDTMGYTAQPGEQVTFNASGSYAIDSEITTYEWDFNGDNVFEQTTTVPQVDHVYDQPFDGLVQLRVTAANGTVANASATVKIDTVTPPNIQPEAPKNLTASIASTTNRLSSVDLTWETQLGDAPITSWVISVDGVVIGTLQGNVWSIQVTDVSRDRDVELGVAGMTPAGVVGHVATTLIAKLPPEPPKETPTETPFWQYIRNLLWQIIEHYRRWHH